MEDIFNKKVNLKSTQEKVKQLRERYDIRSKESQKLLEETTELEAKNEKLGQRLLALVAEEQKLNQKIIVSQKHNEKTTQRRNFNVTNEFELFCTVLGYSFIYESWNKEHQVEIVKCKYKENCYVRLAICSSGAKDLLEIVPNHPNFTNIRRFLQLKQDVGGLLAVMHQYFKNKELTEKSTCMA